MTRKPSTEELHARVEELEQTNKRQQEEKQALSAKIDSLLQQHETLKSFCHNMQQEYHHNLHNRPINEENFQGQFDGLFDDQDYMLSINITKDEAETTDGNRSLPHGDTVDHSHGRTQAFGAHFEPVEISRNSVTPSPSKCSKRSLASDDDGENRQEVEDGKLPARMSKSSEHDPEGETIRLEQAISGMHVEYKATQVLPKVHKSDRKGGKEMEILCHFYPARSLPSSLWEYEHVDSAWIPSLLCRHCLGRSRGTEVDQEEGKADACVQLQRRIGKTLSCCLEHIKACQPDMMRKHKVPLNPSNNLDTMLRKNFESMFNEEDSVSDSSSESSGSEAQTSGEESKAKANEMIERMKASSLVLIDDEWEEGILESTLYIMRQMMPWYIRKSDCTNFSVFSDCTPNSRTLVCRHCLAFQSFSSCEAAVKYFHYGHRHLLNTCTHCPEDVKQEISRLKEKDFRKTDQKRELLVKVFDRLYQFDWKDMTRAQDAAILRLQTSQEGITDHLSGKSSNPARTGIKRSMTHLYSQRQSKVPKTSQNNEGTWEPLLGGSLMVVDSHSNTSGMVPHDLHSIGDITNDWDEDFLEEMVA
jgi:hypothetical protein